MYAIIRSSFRSHTRKSFGRSFVFFAAIIFLSFLASCGGAGVTQPPPPPPPPPPGFIVSIEAPSIPLQQQGISQGQSISILPTNGFTGTVSVSFQNLPAGISVTPPGPYSIVAGGSQSVTLSASTAAAIGNATLTVSGTSGTLTETASFAVTISAAMFQLTAQPPSLTLAPGATATVQITASNNSGPVPNVVFNIPNLANTGLTATENPTEPQPNSIFVTVQASPLAQTVVNFPLIITADATNNFSNTAAVTIPVSVTNSAPSTAPLTRSTMVRTDTDPTGAVYDRARKLLFVTVRQLNEVLVYSTVDASLRATLSLDQPQGIDESLDGTKVYVGNSTSFVAVIDPDLLQVTQFLPGPPPINPSVPTNPLYPVTLATLSNGKVLVQAADGGDLGPVGSFFLWDPSAGTYNLLNVPSIGSGLIVSRSADHSKVLIGSPNEPTPLALYNSATNSFTVSGNIVMGGASPGIAALSPDGSQIAFPAGGNVTLFDDSFNQTGTIALNDGPPLPPQFFYSLDGKFLYASSGGGIPAITVVDTSSLKIVGSVPATENNVAAVFFGVDETGMLFGIVSRGVSFTDASSPSNIRLPAPSLDFSFGPTLLNPAGSTSTVLSSFNLSPGDQYQLFFGAAPASPNTQPVTSFSVTSSTAIQITAPPSTIRGVANATLTRNDGWNAVSPDAISYGPQILRLTVNAGPASGGTQIQIYGYGFISPATTVSIGGIPATVTQVAGPGFISPFPFPMHRITLTTPAGVSGPADVTVTTPDGSTTLSEGFQYLAQAQVFPKAGELNQMAYDRTRQKLYISNTDHNQIEIFSLSSMSYLTAIPVGSEPFGIALTPDGSKLAVVNAGGGTVSVINPDTQAVIAVYPVLTTTDSASLCQGQANFITPAGSHGMFVDIICTAVESQGTLHFLDLNTGSLSCSAIPFCSASLTNIVVPQSTGIWAMASSPDGTKVLMGDAGGGVQLILDLNANTAVTTIMPLQQGSGDNPTVNADVNRFATNFGIYDAQLNSISFPQDIDYLDAGNETLDLAAGQKLSPSGSLLFVPQFVEDVFPSSVDIYDVYRGRLVMRISLPDPIPGSLDSLALDETGSRIFLITNTGISILQIAQLPLSIATVTSSTASVGDQVTIRGSGFKTGATVMFGTAIASATVVDANTITATVPSLSPGPCRITVTNPDGTQYSIDAAFSVQ